jgi:hypothetical protein
LPFRPLPRLAKDEEPGRAGSDARGRGGLGSLTKSGQSGASFRSRSARAEQSGRMRMRRIGVLLTFAESDPEVKAWLTAFEEALQLCLSVLSLVASLRHGS